MKLVNVLEHISQQKLAGSKKAGVDIGLYWGDRSVSLEKEDFSGAEPRKVGADEEVLDNPNPLKGK